MPIRIATPADAEAIAATEEATRRTPNLLDWARNDPRVGKIELSVRAGNLRARGLYRRLGCVEEARFHGRVRRIDGAFEDDLGMAWFPRRWPAPAGGDTL